MRQLSLRIVLVFIFALLMIKDTIAQTETCERGYDPSVAISIGQQYKAALKARDYAKLKELKAKKDQLDLWKRGQGTCPQTSEQNGGSSEDSEHQSGRITRDNASKENCETVFAEYQQIAQAFLDKAGPDGRARNKAINQAYARLALDYPEFKWAGLATVASFNVGCAMDHITELQSGSVSGVLTEVFADLDLVQDSLERGNQTLFLDIYTWHQLQINNPEAIAHCETSAGFPVNDFVKNGFAKTQGNEADQWESLTDLAIHEQYNILGTAIYQDQDFREQLDANERLGELPYTTPATAVLSSNCDDDREDRRNVFSNSTPLFGWDHLWDDDQRMNWIAGVDTEGDPTNYDGHIAAQWQGLFTPRVSDGHKIIVGPHGPELIKTYKDGEAITEEERRRIIEEIFENP